MKHTFSKDSIHFKLAQFGLFDYDLESPEYNSEATHNSCRYILCMARGLLFLAVIGMLIAAGGWLLAQFLFGIGFSIFYGTFMFTEYGAAVGIILLAAMVVAPIIYGVNKLSDIRRHKRYDKRVHPEKYKDGFISTMYNSIKGKYCITLEFK